MENQESIPLERVTKKVKDPKKVAAGRAGAAAKKAKQEQILKNLNISKHSLNSESINDDIVEANLRDAPSEQGDDHNIRVEKSSNNWTLWIIMGAVTSLAAFALIKATQMKLPTPVVESKNDQLDTKNDPFYMN